MEQLFFPDNEFPGLAGLPQNQPSQVAPFDSTTGDDGTAFSTADNSSKDAERVPLSMRPKRAGRKLDTKEPESKRRAQNRAAQRAFRDRKERHLKDLELRIQELEQESATWRNSSILLRSKVSELEQQLNTQPPTSSTAVTPTPASHQSAPRLSQNTNSAHMPSPSESNYSKNNSPPHRNPNTDFIDSFATSGSTSSGATPAQAAMGENPSSTEFCDELNLACVVPSGAQSSGFLARGAPPATPQVPTPASIASSSDRSGIGFKRPPRSLSESRREAQVSRRGSFNGDSSSSNGGHTPFKNEVAPDNSLTAENQQLPSVVPNGALMPELDLLKELQNQIAQQPARAQAPTPAPARSKSQSQPQPQSQTQPGSQGAERSVFDFSFQDNQPFDVSSFVNNDSTLFDGFDLDAVWNYDSMPMNTGSSTSDQFAGPQGSSSSSTTTTTTKDPFRPVQTPSLEANAPEIVPATREKYISCTEVWDRICSRPRFGDIDIQGMCMELRAKAKCSDSGVVLPEQDVDELLNSYK